MPVEVVPVIIGAYNQRAPEQQEIDFANKVFELTNKEREKAGLPPLKRLDTLTDMATTRAWELTVSYSHNRPDGSSCFSIIEENGLRYRAVGENIAAGQKTPEQVVSTWMNSAGHRDNILKEKYEYIGVGFYLEPGSSGYSYHWVQMFYTPL